MRIIDISHPVGAGVGVWPGDEHFALEWTLSQDRGDSVNVAAVTLSVHTGTHADGPHHVLQHGARARDLPLQAFIGPALVVDMRGAAVMDERVIEGVAIEPGVRVLFRQRESVDPRDFPTNFIAPTPALARRLVALGVPLVGTDAPSMDPFDSKSLETHRIFAEAGVMTLENLLLVDVSPGEYTLVALPLALVDADSSPVRAVLIDDEAVRQSFSG